MATWLNSALTGVSNFVKSDAGKGLLNVGIQALTKPKGTNQPVGNFADQPLPYASRVAFQSSPTGSVSTASTSSTMPKNLIYWIVGAIVALFLLFKLKRK